MKTIVFNMTYTQLSHLDNTNNRHVKFAAYFLNCIRDIG